MSWLVPYILDSVWNDECIDFTMMCVFLDSEQSDECIGLTMMCVIFYFYVCTR